MYVNEKNKPKRPVLREKIRLRTDLACTMSFCRSWEHDLIYTPLLDVNYRLCIFCLPNSWLFCIKIKKKL